MDNTPLTAKEKKAITALKNLAKTWPKSLWLFSASGTLCVMKYSRSENGEGMYSGAGAGVDRKGIVETIHGIPNDGGDW